MILKNLWRRKTRTLLTMLGIAVGVAAVVALSAFGEGFASGFESIFGSTNADLTVGQKEAVMLLISSVDESIGDEIEAIPGVDTVSGTIISMVQMTESPYFVVMGEDPRSFTIAHYRLIAGSMISGRKQILLGKITAENFNKQVGESFRLNDVTYRVVGIYETGVSLEDGGAVMSLDDAQGLFDKKYKVNYFNVKVEDKARIDEIKSEIEARWPELIASRSGDASQQDDAINMYRSFGWFLGIFAIMVGGLGMMNTTMMSVLERTREIGVLRAMGWKASRVVWLIMGESLALAIGGGLLGIGLGIGLVQLASTVPAVESLLAGVFTPMMFVQAMTTAVLLGVVGGVFPAWRAAQLAPVEAMRYDSGVGAHMGGFAQLMARLMGNSALRNLWRRPTRTLVTVLGVGIGVGFVVSLLGMVAGFYNQFNLMAGAGQADLLAEQSNTADLSLSVIDERTADQIATMPEVKSVSKIIFGVSSATGLPYFLVFGVDPSEEYIHHFRIHEGRSILRPGEVMIGLFASNSLKKTVGDSIRISGNPYQIVGIYETGTAYEDAGAAVSLKEAQAMFNKRRQVSLVGITLTDEARDRADEIAERLEREFPEIIVARSSEFAQGLNDMKVTEAVLNALIVLIMIVGGIVMMNAMLMSVFERTQEIGVLRAMGWRRWRIVSMVLVESLAVSAASAVLGIGIGVGLTALLVMEPTMGYFMTPDYSPRVFVEVIVLALVLGAIGGVYPAWRAAGLRPIEALRYE